MGRPEPAAVIPAGRAYAALLSDGDSGAAPSGTAPPRARRRAGSPGALRIDDSPSLLPHGRRHLVVAQMVGKIRCSAGL